MRFNGLDLNLLVALDTLLECRSVTEAASRLHLSPSAVSCALSRLRDQLEDELLTKVGRKMYLTPFAESLLGEVRSLLVEIDATLRAKPVFVAADSTRHFRVAASDYVIQVALMEAQRKIAQQTAGVSLELLPISEDADGYLDSGEVDLLVVPGRFANARRPSEELFTDSIVCMVWADNQRVGDRIDLDGYLSMDHVAYQPKGEPFTFEKWLLSSFGRKKIRSSAYLFSLLPHFVIGTNMVATLPLRFARACARNYPLRIVMPDFDIPPFTEFMIWHQSKDRDPGLAWLRTVIHSSVQDHHEAGHS